MISLKTLLSVRFDKKKNMQAKPSNSDYSATRKEGEKMIK